MSFFWGTSTVIPAYTEVLCLKRAELQNMVIRAFPYSVDQSKMDVILYDSRKLEQELSFDINFNIRFVYCLVPKALAGLQSPKP